MRYNLNFAISRLRDLDGIAEVTDAPVDLDLLVEELLEGADIENLVAGGLRGVDDELCRNYGQRTMTIAIRRGCLTLLVTLGPLPLTPTFLCTSRNDLSLLLHAMILRWRLPTTGDTGEGLGQQQSGVIYILSEWEPSRSWV